MRRASEKGAKVRDGKGSDGQDSAESGGGERGTRRGRGGE